LILLRVDSFMPIAPNSSRVVFQKLERDLIKLSSKSGSDSVHGFRTGTRRLQILLAELSPKLHRSQKKLLKLLGRIRKRAGKVRDLDVQLAALRGLKVPREPKRKTRLIHQLIELRGRQEKKLRKAVDKDTVREICRRLKRARKSFRPETSRDPLAVARGMIKDIERGDAPITEALLHQYRIVSKRARYAAEFSGKSAEAEQFIAGVKRLQDALGDWHDWLTLTQSASLHLGDMRESSLVAELHNVTGAKFRHAVAVLSRMRGERSTVTPIAAVKAPGLATLPKDHPSSSAA
jgi:CHAD domain-containing protein